MVFDVAASVPEDSAMWQGMSGAAVRDAHGRLLGVVVQVDKQYQQRRLYVVPLPDPALDAAFGRALTQVGAPAVLEASDAPALRGLLALLDAAGRPYPVAALPELGDLGVRRSRTDVDTRGDPYYPYVYRDIDRELRAALDRRLDGAERRMLLLTGDAMAGKSRTLAEALVRHPRLAARPLLIPHHGADLRQALECAAARGGVVWLDDVNTYATGLDGAVRALAGTPGVIMAATLRTDQFSRLQDNPDLRLMWDVLSETRLVEQVTLETGWADGEQARLAGTESLIRDAVTRGRPLGEALGAADELQKRLHFGSAPEQAIVFTAADWPRTGYPAPLAEDLARQLWLTHLPPSAAADLAEMVDEESERAFREALSWACAKVAGASALVRRTKNGLIAEDYIVALRTTENVTIPDAIWYQARDLALSTGQAREQLAVAVQAEEPRSSTSPGRCSNRWCPVVRSSPRPRRTWWRRSGSAGETWQGPWPRTASGPNPRTFKERSRRRSPLPTCCRNWETRSRRRRFTSLSTGPATNCRTATPSCRTSTLRSPSSWHRPG